MIFRDQLLARIKAYSADDIAEIKHVLEILSESDEVELSNKEIGQVWERISKALDVRFSDDENHDAWSLESELSKAYKYD